MTTMAVVGKAGDISVTDEGIHSYLLPLRRSADVMMETASMRWTSFGVRAQPQCRAEVGGPYGQEHDRKETN